MSKDQTLKRRDSGLKSISDLNPQRAKWSTNRRLSIMSNMSTGSKRYDPTPDVQKTLPPTYRFVQAVETDRKVLVKVEFCVLNTPLSISFHQ